MRGNVKVYQKKIVDRRRKKFFFYFLLAILVIGLVFSGLSYISHLDSLNINEVAVEGTNRLDPSVVIALADARLEGSYGYFFSRRNFMLYPQDAIRDDIASLPLVKSVKVNDRRMNSSFVLSISITERGEDAVWCGSGAEGTKGCFSVDGDGFIFASTTNQTAIAYSSKVEDNKGIGSQVMAAEDFKNIQFFVRELSVLKVNPSKIVMGDVGYMEVLLEDGGTLVINSSDDLSAVLSNLSAVISDKALVPDLQSFLSNLDYVRLDAGNKVFYKMKE